MKFFHLSGLLLVTLFYFAACRSKELAATKQLSSPRIINIVNFIRQTDYRVKDADSLLFDAVEKQVALSNRYAFPTTFLFQYDALINPRYQQLMKEKLHKRSEIGAWWEITQPHVEAAGIPWRGEHSWVSTANIAFTPGYTQAEREKLVDVYMQKFKSIYGFYPKSVGSWFIDSYTLQYMYDQYGIVASSNCKDQVGTDGYTLWGGYWNQAYYPSKKNAYMPAQTVEAQIPVPIFRMLGSDPMYQYDAGIGTQYQTVISLEPVYPESGKNKAWVDYFLKSIVDEPALAFNYAQAGQENSFTWAAMREGLEMQFPLFDSLRALGKVRIETLAASGKWFKENFKQTPATAITTQQDVRGAGNKSVWYNSRFYRANLFWEKDGFCFRDIHLFDEHFPSKYWETPGTGNQFFYYTLPVVDRFHWSTATAHVGLRIIALDAAGKSTALILQNPVVTELSATALQVACTDKHGQPFKILLQEDHIQIETEASNTNWVLELRVPEQRLARLPFQQYEEQVIHATFEQYNYSIQCREGRVLADDPAAYVFRLAPSADQRLIIDCVANKPRS